MAHFVAVALGSGGDVNPFLGLMKALGARGHRTTYLSAPRFEGAAAEVGAEFAPLGTAEAYDAIYDDPQLWHPRHGLRVYFRYLATLVDETAARVEERYEPGETVVLAPFQCFGARVAREATGVPTCTVLPYPVSIQSAYDPNRNPVANPPSWLGPWGARLMYSVVNLEITRHARGGVEAARKARALPPLRGDVVSWSYSPDLIVGLWPKLFSARQPDWPAHALRTGFVTYDGPAAERWSPPEDLPDRDDWLVFTPGTQMTHGAEYFRAACAAAQRLGHPTLMVSSDRSALPEELPANVRHLDFAPFAWLFRRASAVVHHGGIGTCARALESGLPQLIVPRAFDQFDNAHRVVRIGAGATLDRRWLHGERFGEVLHDLLNDEAVRRRCVEIRDELAATDGTAETCDRLETLVGH